MNAAGIIVLIVLALGVGLFERLWRRAQARERALRIDLLTTSGNLAIEELKGRAARDTYHAARERWAIDEDVLADRLARETARADRAELARDRVVAASATERSRLLRELADMGEAVQKVTRIAAERTAQAREDAALAVGLALTKLAQAEEQLVGYEAGIEEADRVATLLAAAYAQELERRRTAQRFIEGQFGSEDDPLQDVIPVPATPTALRAIRGAKAAGR